MRIEHTPTCDNDGRLLDCAKCGETWPCDVARLTAEVERLQGELDRPRHQTLRQLADALEHYAAMKKRAEQAEASREEWKLRALHAEKGERDALKAHTFVKRNADLWAEKAEQAEAALAAANERAERVFRELKQVHDAGQNWIDVERVRYYLSGGDCEPGAWEALRHAAAPPEEKN